MIPCSYHTALSFVITLSEQSYLQFNSVRIVIPLCWDVLSVHNQTSPYLNMGASSHIGTLRDLRPDLGLQPRLYSSLTNRPIHCDTKTAKRLFSGSFNRSYPNKRVRIPNTQSLSTTVYNGGGRLVGASPQRSFLSGEKIFLSD